MKLSLLLLGCAAIGSALQGASKPDIASVPLAFTKAHDPASPVRYQAFGRGVSVQLTDDAAFIISGNARMPLRVVGANPAARPAAQAELPGKVNFLIGSDSSQWRTSIPTFSKVAYAGVLPGIDLVYYGNARRLEYDFNVAPGADARRIQLEIGEGWNARLTAQGALEMRSRDGHTFHFDKPVSYQLAATGERSPVSTSYRLHGSRRFSFTLGAYDRSRPLVIDPVLLYGTYLGGSPYVPLHNDDFASAIAIDGAGNAYVTGETKSAQFPITGSAPVSNCIGVIGNGDPRFCTGGGNFDDNIYRSEIITYAFVTKLNPQGTQVLYSTYLGGSNVYLNQKGNAVTVDSAGNAYVAGETFATNFPTTPNAVQTSKASAMNYLSCQPYTPQGTMEAFVAKLNPSGTALLYSTYLGGSGNDFAAGIAVSAGGDIFVTGGTDSGTNTSGSGAACFGQSTSSGFPITANAAYGEVVNRDYSPRGFYSRIAANGSLAYSTYIGAGRLNQPPNPNYIPPGSIQGTRITIDNTGAAYIAGSTRDGLFGGGCQSCTGPNGVGRFDQYIIKFNPGGTIGYGPNLIGGSSTDDATGVALDVSGNAYVSGYSYNPVGDGSSNRVEFPTTAGVYQPARGNPGLNNGCPTLVKYSPAGARLWSTFVCGGPGIPNTRDAFAYAVAVDPLTQTPVITGRFDSTLPTVNAVASPVPGFEDTVFLARLTADGTALLLSSPIARPGGIDISEGYGLAVDSQMNAFVAGVSQGTAVNARWMATPGAYNTAPDPSYNSTGFIAKVNMLQAPQDCQANVSAQMAITRGGLRFNAATQRFLQTITIRNNGAAVTSAAFVLDSLSPNASLPEQGGRTPCGAPSGASPYLNLGTLNPGQTVNLNLSFANPGNQSINYTTRVLAGAGVR